MKIYVKFNEEHLTYSSPIDSYRNWFEMISLDFIYHHRIKDPCQLFLYKNNDLIDNWNIQDEDVIEAIVKPEEDLLFFNPSVIYRKWNKKFENDYEFKAIWINYINNCYNIYLISNLMKDTLVCEDENEAREMLVAYQGSDNVFQRLDRLIEILRE